MGRILTTAVLTVVVGLLVGMGVGGFISYTTTKDYLKSVPGAPLVVGAGYDEDKNALVLDVYNSGGLPIAVSEGQLVFKPKEGEGYAIASVPIRTTIPSTSIVRIEIKLKEQTVVKEGDLISGTIVYAYPYIPQIYTATFKLTFGEPLPPPKL